MHIRQMCAFFFNILNTKSHNFSVKKILSKIIKKFATFWITKYFPRREKSHRQGRKRTAIEEQSETTQTQPETVLCSKTQTFMEKTTWQEFLIPICILLLKTVLKN